MKIAIISDIHGNLEALKATLKDIEKRTSRQNNMFGRYNSKRSTSKECIKLIKEQTAK